MNNERLCDHTLFMRSILVLFVFFSLGDSRSFFDVGVKILP